MLTKWQEIKCYLWIHLCHIFVGFQKTWVKKRSKEEKILRTTSPTWKVSRLGYFFFFSVALDQGFSIIFLCGPQRAEDSSKIDVWGPNDHHFPMYFYVYWSWQRAKQVWSAGWIWPNGRHLRRPALDHIIRGCDMISKVVKLGQRLQNHLKHWALLQIIPVP